MRWEGGGPRGEVTAHALTIPFAASNAECNLITSTYRGVEGGIFHPLCGV